MEINILDPNIVNLIIRDINTEQNLQRKRNEYIAYQSTQGMLKDYVTARLATLFPKNYKKMRVSDISVSQKVVDKLSQAYCEAPIRTVPGADESTMEELNTIYKQGKFNTTFQDYDEIFNLHRHGLYWVDYDLTNTIFRTSALRPFEYDIIKDPNTGEVLCVVLNYPDQDVTRRNLYATMENAEAVSDGINQLIAESQYDSGIESKVYAMWTKTAHVVVVMRKKTLDTGNGTNVNYAVDYVPLPNNPNNINPLGIIPFVHKQKSSAADYPTFNPITEQTINFNILMSDLLTAASMQGFGQATLSYPDSSEVQEIEIGYMTAIKLPQSIEPNAPKTEFKFENANPDLQGQQKTYLTYLKQVLAEHGITSNQAITGDVEQYASGIDRIISNADVNKIVQKNQNVYAEMENEIFQIIKKWQSLVGINTFNNVEEILVTYPRTSVQITESETIKNVIALLEAGLISKQKALMKLNPNLTEDQAKEELVDIAEESQEIADEVKLDRKSENGPVPRGTEEMNSKVSMNGAENGVETDSVIQ